MRMRKKPNLIPRMERCAHLQVFQPEALQGSWHKGDRPLYVELGCGKGRFTVETAASLPEVDYVAVERVPDAMVIAMERANERGLENVRFIDMDAAKLCEIFAPGEIDRLYINFCDPWPTKKHAKRRLTSDRFLPLYAQALRPGGQIHFKTDNAPLFEYSVEMFEAMGWALSEVTRNLHENGVCGVMTDYEAKFYEQGIPINRCVAVFKGKEA